MNYKEFKTLCLEKIQELAKTENLTKGFLRRFKKEVVKAKSYYLDGIDLYEEFKTKKALNRYVLPYVLGFNEDYDLSKPMELIQTKDGASGGIDIDSDFENSGRDLIIEYLKGKYGEDCVFPVGTTSMLGIKSAAKDLLKYYEVPFKESNDFTSILDNELTFEENIERIKENDRNMYNFYLRNKRILDLTPKFINKARQSCLPSWSKINVEGGKKEISELDSTVDSIAFLNKAGDVSYTNNYNVVYTGKQKFFKITMEDGTVLEATANHKIFTGEGVKIAEDLKVGDDILYSSCV